MLFLLENWEAHMKVTTDVPSRTFSLTADSKVDENNLIRINYIVVGDHRKWYQFWKKSPTVKLTMSGDNNEYLKMVTISF